MVPGDAPCPVDVLEGEQVARRHDPTLAILQEGEGVVPADHHGSELVADPLAHIVDAARQTGIGEEGLKVVPAFLFLPANLASAAAIAETIPAWMK